MGLFGFLLYCALVVPPFWMLTPRAGLSPYWALVAILPIGAAGLLWYMALVRWPGDGGAGHPGGRV